ncbi:hypothetical protein [Haloquadratum walsbyi]|jgi:hypothetical protein|uniref:DUF973 family protein n=2 Tax=Haloquadratum walsbyi TaxID=293091 RepID=Q18IS3_HALWD|nr:hypothetical protein [Haloquadratum walsbyi]CAJ52094.1 uncharacterized protein HQ_1966A [Haloquadratum walsbyi DSM 16790]
MSAGNTPESTTEVPTETSEVNSGISVSTLAQVIGIFIFAGIGIGATAGITITQLGSGSAILGGILTLVVLTIVFLLGPVIGLIAGLRVGSENGATTTSYLVSFLGSTAGYFAMIIVVILAMSVAMIGGGGGSAVADTATQTAMESDSSRGLPIGEYLIPIITVALPTGLTGLGGTYIGGKQTPSAGGMTLPIRYVTAGIVVIALVATGGLVIPDLINNDPQLEVDGSASAMQGTLYADAKITNPTDNDVDNTVTAELVIDGEVVATEDRDVMVSADDESEISWEIIAVSDLSSAQLQAIRNGDLEIRYSINDQTVDTYTLPA